MLKKSITFENLNGEEITEDFYFNVSKVEAVEMEIGEKEGLSDMLKRIVETGDRHGLVQEFKKVILMSYGVRSDDGKRFIKSDELRDAFQQTEAFSNVFFELATNDEAASEFINGIFPKDLTKLMAEVRDKNPERSVETVELPDDKPKEAKDMSREELLEAFNAKVRATQE